MLFASAEPLDEKSMGARLPQGVDVRAALERLQEEYATRGVNLVSINGKWTFRTSSDLSWLLSKETVETRKLSRAAIETLAIIAYHQPVTRWRSRKSAADHQGLGRRCWRPDGSPAAGAKPRPAATYGTSEAFCRISGSTRSPICLGRRAQGFRPARRPPAARLRGSHAVGRSGAARGRGSARARRSRSHGAAAERISGYGPTLAGGYPTGGFVNCGRSPVKPKFLNGLGAVVTARR
jgi:hypothetical protein